MSILKPSARFKKDYKLCKKRGYDMAKLQTVLAILASDSPIPPEYHDHPLKNNWLNHRDLHIEPDWLLIYKREEEAIILLAATGTHSDLFK